MEELFEGAPVVRVESVAQWRAWLETNHDTVPSAWLVMVRGGEPGYEDAVCQALCFGWIDSVKKPRDDTSTYQRFGPRRPGSSWVKSNRLRVERLVSSGEMTLAGQAVVDAAKASGAWDLLAEIEEGIVPDDVRLALDAVPEAATQFAAFPAGVRKLILTWIVSAKRPETRSARIAVTVEKAARGERAQG